MLFNEDDGCIADSYICSENNRSYSKFDSNERFDVFVEFFSAVGDN